MKTKTFLSILFITIVLTMPAFGQPYDYGDAPEGVTAYPFLPAPGVTGAFPTCINVPIATWIQHDNFGAFFGPAVDLENEGNGG